MKYLRYLALVGLLMLPLAYSQAEVRVGVGVGFGPTFVAGPPVCPWGYYAYYPYACAPYGYYGPSWFVNGVFIGAGPWFHGFGHHFVGPRFFGRGIPPRRFEGHGFVGRGFEEHRFGGRGFGGGRFHGGHR